MTPFDDVLESVQQGVVLLDDNLIVLNFNSHALEIMERGERAIWEGMHADELLDPAEYCFAASSAKSTLTTGWLAEFLAMGGLPSQFTLSNGRTVSIACARSRSGGWVLTCDDVSRLARVERKLAEQNRRFDAALSNMPHGLCMFDESKRLILCNASYARMYGLPLELTAPGTALDNILKYRASAGNGPADNTTYFDVVAEAAVTGLIASQNVYLADGRVIKITHNPMENGGYVATHEDVSATVRTSEELREHRDTLEETVALRTEEIEQQAHELERLLDQERNINELQRQFVTMASHEFRTPLTIIDAAAQRLIRRKGDMEPQFLAEKIDQIRNSVTRIVDLMESILSAGRLDNGVVKVRYEPCALGTLIRACCDRQEQITKGHRFLLDFDRLPERIDGDRQTLEQVFTNLLSNAVKYSPLAPDIYVMGWEENGFVKIVVKDCGIGIDTEDLPRMFQRYFRARTSTGIAGTGIGLNLVKQIVELHGGSIEVTSERGVGSTFTVSLPTKSQNDKALPSTDAA